MSRSRQLNRIAAPLINSCLQYHQSSSLHFARSRLVAADRQWNLTSRSAAAFSTSCPRLGQSEDGKTESSEEDLPQLSDMTKRFAPNPYRSMRNAFFTHGIIKPYFDPGFDLADFKAGARKAVATVSGLLSRGDFEALEDMMETTCFDEVKRRLSFTSADQRTALQVADSNILSDFVYEVGIMFNDDTPGDRYVEVTYVAHGCKASPDEVISQMDGVNSFKQSMDVYSKSKPFVLNYRFLRRYKKGQDPDTFNWIVSAVNHFSPDKHP